MPESFDHNLECEGGAAGWPAAGRPQAARRGPVRSGSGTQALASYSTPGSREIIEKS